MSDFSRNLEGHVSEAFESLLAAILKDDRPAAIRCLLEAGVDANAQDKNGAAPLHRAVRTRCIGAVRCLFDAGCSPTIRNKAGSTPFHLAVQTTGRGGSGEEEAKNAQRAIIMEFLSRGVNMRLKDGKGKSVVACANSDWIRDLLVK